MFKVENYNGVVNQFLLFDTITNTLVFQSYNSIIAEVRDGELIKIHNDWDYSRTTLRWFKRFINDYTTEKYETKKQFIKDVIEKKFKYIDQNNCLCRVDYYE